MGNFTYPDEFLACTSQDSTDLPCADAVSLSVGGLTYVLEEIYDEIVMCSWSAGFPTCVFTAESLGSGNWELTWTSTNGVSATIYPPGISVPLNGLMVVSPTENTIYSLTITGFYGVSVCTASAVFGTGPIITPPDNPFPPPGSPPPTPGPGPSPSECACSDTALLIDLA